MGPQLDPRLGPGASRRRLRCTVGGGYAALQGLSRGLMCPYPRPGPCPNSFVPGADAYTQVATTASDYHRQADLGECSYTCDSPCLYRCCYLALVAHPRNRLPCGWCANPRTDPAPPPHRAEPLLARSRVRSQPASLHMHALNVPQGTHGAPPNCLLCRARPRSAVHRD